MGEYWGRGNELDSASPCGSPAYDDLCSIYFLYHPSSKELGEVYLVLCSPFNPHNEEH